MSKYQISISQDVPFEVIRAALANLGDVTIRPVIAKTPKTERVYQEPVIVYKDGIAVYEIDGIEVEKRIAKIMCEANRGKSSDGRTKANYDRASMDYARRKNAAEYIQTFCSSLNHVKTGYELNREIITA